MSKDKMSNTTLQHKRTSVSGNVPEPEQLEVGEIALNLADKIIFTKDGTGQVLELSNPEDYLHTTAYGFDNTVDSAAFNKLTVGPDSADDSKIYFETGAGTHTLEGREEGAIDMNAWLTFNTQNPSYSWSGITYGDGKWVAVSQNGDQRVMYSTNGYDWTYTDAAAQSNWTHVIYDGSKFIAIAVLGVQNSKYIMHSSDGITWDPNDLYTLPGGSINWYELAYDGSGMYVAVGNGRALAYSTDAKNWTQGTPPASHTSGSYSAVEYANGTWVVVGSAGVMTSTDGITWTARNTDGSWNDVAYGNGTWVAVTPTASIGAASSRRVMYSTDNGVTWTNLSLPISLVNNMWGAITYGDGKFVAVATSGSQRVMWSTDGINWVDQSVGSNQWHHIHYADKKFIGVGLSNSNGHLLVLEHDANKAGLFYDGALVATTENLRPVYDKLLELLQEQLWIDNGDGTIGYSGGVISQGSYFSLDTDLSDSVVNSNNALYTDSDGVDYADVKLFLRSLHDRIESGGFDSAGIQNLIDASLSGGSVVTTVNGVGPSPSGDIGIHGGNTQTDAGSGTLIRDALDAKVKRITDTNTGTNYNPTNGVVSLPLATTSSVQGQIDTSISDLKFLDSADVATVVDPKLPFGGSSQMTILHASWDASAGTTTPTILSSYGISGITRIDVGEYRVDFMTNMVNSNYTVTTGCGTNDYSGTGASPRTVSVLSRANSSVTVLCERTDDAVNEDNEYMSVMIIGNQVSS